MPPREAGRISGLLRAWLFTNPLANGPTGMHPGRVLAALPQGARGTVLWTVQRQIHHMLITWASWPHVTRMTVMCVTCYGCDHCAIMPQEGHVPKSEDCIVRQQRLSLRDAFCGLGHVCEVVPCGLYSSTYWCTRGGM
jgi:hypothetical protein